MGQFTFHVVSLPHTQTSTRYNSCAYTMKVLHFVQMMRSLGHKVVHYGNEGSDLGCDAEHVTLFSKAEQERFFGRPADPNELYALDWSGRAPYWELFNGRAAVEITMRVKEKTEFLCIIIGGGIGLDTMNRVNRLVGDKLGTALTTVEFGIGYTGTFSKFRVFESYSHMHKQWGAEGSWDPDGRFYDVVIPNYFDPRDYPFSSKPEDYYLYMGRMIFRKGVRIAVDTARHVGAKLLMAGQGVVSVQPGRIVTEDNNVYEGDHLQYLGIADVATRARLLAGARAVFVPTIYIEPFGGIAVEAQMAGTPVITTDFGAFTETVEHGKTGFRCRTMKEFVAAARAVDQLDRQYIHDRAVARYSLDVVRHQYDRYFRSLLDLWRAGWYELEEPASDWEIAQKWESEWWGDCDNERVVEEQAKQDGYMENMGLSDFDFGGRSVLDVGGGPASVLLRAKNVGRRKVVDPLRVPAWVHERYRAAGIEVDQLPGEEMDESGWDLVMFYNVLQHTRDPERVVRNARKAARELHVFEWLDTPTNEGHPHTLTRAQLEAWTGSKGTVKEFTGDRGLYGKAWCL